MTTRNALRSRLATLGGLTLLFVALAALPPPAIAAGAVTDDNVAEKSAEAKTKADHEALAAYFQEKAANAAKTAKLHEKMGRATVSGSGKGQVGMDFHCRNVARAARSMEEAYEQLAAEHTRMAKEAAE